MKDKRKDKNITIDAINTIYGIKSCTLRTSSLSEGEDLCLALHHSLSMCFRCGKGPEEFCETEEEAREFLQQEDPMVYEALVYTFTDDRDQLSSDLEICQYWN